MNIIKQKLYNKYIDKFDAFRDTKWGKFSIRLVLFSCIAYIFYKPIQIAPNELVELKITTYGEFWEGNTSDHIKLYFKAKEYPSPFGISIGGIYNEREKVIQSLEENSSNIVKIQKSSLSKLNLSNQVVPIFYLNNLKRGKVFDENTFNKEEKSSHLRYLGLIFLLFLISLWKSMRKYR